MTKKRSPRTCVTRNSTMRPSVKRYLHHCSFRREENQRTEIKLSTLLKKVCCQLSPFSHAHVRGDPCTNQIQICLKNGNQVEIKKTSESGFSLKDKEQILVEVRSEFQKHELQAKSVKKSIQELTEIIDSQRMEIDHTFTGCEHLCTNLDRQVRAQKNHVKWNTKQSGFSLKEKQQILAVFTAEIQKHEFQAHSDRRSIQELKDLSSLSEEKLIILLQVMNNIDEINYFS